MQNNLFGSTICKICAKCLKQQFENSKRKLCKMITYKLICPDQEYAKFVQNVYNSNLKNLNEKVFGTIQNNLSGSTICKIDQKNAGTHNLQITWNC